MNNNKKRLVNKKILNCSSKIKSIHRRCYLPECLFLNLLLCLVVEYGKIIYFNKILYDLKKGQYYNYFLDEVAFSVYTERKIVEFCA